VSAIAPLAAHARTVLCIALDILAADELPGPLIAIARRPLDNDDLARAAELDVVLGDPGVGMPGMNVVQRPEGADAAAAQLMSAINEHPLTSKALVMLLRGAADQSVRHGLVNESTTYSMLQGSPEFREWLRSRPPPRPRDDGPCVRVQRDDAVLRVTLSRPHVHNAFNARMRDELLDALAVAAADPSIESVELSGDGPSFCSGGDLDEFGTAPDPTTAHFVRVERSAGAALHAVADRVTAHIHGACFGAGIELPAFASRVVAAPDTVIALPEVGMGLIPGAGGTVSLARRIGRRRTAYLALSGIRLDAATALSWGLVDKVGG
jgi:enoyl-CoA hydratase/carnithine racemase